MYTSASSFNIRSLDRPGGCIDVRTEGWYMAERKRIKKAPGADWAKTFRPVGL